MTATDLLAELERLGVVLLPEGDRLRFRPKQAVPAELVSELRFHKPALLELLRRGNTETETPVDAGENRGFGFGAQEDGEKTLLDVAAYLAEHGQYPPGGIGGPGDLDAYVAEHVADGFARWERRQDSRGVWGWERTDLDVADWDALPEPVEPGYRGDPRPTPKRPDWAT